MKILIAEDDPVAARILQLTLEYFGHQVIVTENGQSAWDRFDKEPVRIIVSDWMMPDVDGLEFCRRVRSRPKTDYTYFILLTANHPAKDNLRKAMDAGVDDFLAKPLDREAIWMRLRVAERILEYTKQISQLQQLIPICMFCKKVRDDGDYWEQLETYISAQTGSSFTHGICPECYKDQMRKLGL